MGVGRLFETGTGFEEATYLEEHRCQDCVRRPTSTTRELGTTTHPLPSLFVRCPSATCFLICCGLNEYFGRSLVLKSGSWVMIQPYPYFSLSKSESNKGTNIFLLIKI